MFELVLGMELRVVAGVGLPHFPEDFQPSLSQAAKGRGMAFASGAHLLVIDLRPRRKPAARVCPQMDGMSERLVAHPPYVRLAYLAGLETHGRRSDIALEGLGALEKRAIRSHLAEQTRRQFATGSRQRAEKMMVGMLCEEPVDLAAGEAQGSHLNLRFC